MFVFAYNLSIARLLFEQYLLCDRVGLLFGFVYRLTFLIVWVSLFSALKKVGQSA